MAIKKLIETEVSKAETGACDSYARGLVDAAHACGGITDAEYRVYNNRLIDASIATCTRLLAQLERAA
jgi:hypothetical protein